MKRLRQWFVDWLLADLHLQGVSFGEKSITLSPAGVGDVIRWSGTQAALALGDIGMDVATGSPKVFTGGASTSLVSKAGQLGGTGASPTVIGITETGGPTALTIGSIADTLTLVRSGATVIGGLALSSGTWTPTLSLVGGVGNTVPVFSTNLAYYVKVGVWVFFEIYLTGDGGAEGAGTGQLFCALPFTAAADAGTSELFNEGHAGVNYKNSTIFTMGWTLANGGTTIGFGKVTAFNAFAAFTGADLNNTTRGLLARGVYRAAA